MGPPIDQSPVSPGIHVCASGYASTSWLFKYNSSYRTHRLDALWYGNLALSRTKLRGRSYSKVFSAMYVVLSLVGVCSCHVRLVAAAIFSCPYRNILYLPLGGKLPRIPFEPTDS